MRPQLAELLLICVHGFKGTDSTFESFPDRIAYTLSHTWNPTVKVERVVYPQYRTAGELNEAVTNFIAWLVTLVGDKESENGQKGSVGVVLMGHSMGGLVCADTVLGLSKAYNEGNAALWPRVIGLIAYDTPYLGVNPGTFKAGIEQVLDYGSQAYGVASALTAGLGYFAAKKGGQAGQQQRLPPAAAKSGSVSTPDASASASSTKGSSNWLVTAGIAGGAAAAAAAGAALWTNRQALSSFATLGWTETQEHLTYVGELWKQEELAKRLDLVVALDDEGKAAQEKPPTLFVNRVGFHCFYTLMPSSKERPRTFIVLPQPSKKAVLAHFTANENSNAATETDAHVSMFNMKSDGNHDLAMRSTQLITDWVAAQQHGP